MENLNNKLSNEKESLGENEQKPKEEMEFIAFPHIERLVTYPDKEDKNDPISHN